MKKLMLVLACALAVGVVQVKSEEQYDVTKLMAAGVATGSITNTQPGKIWEIQDIYGLYSSASLAAHTITVSKTVSVGGSNANIVIDSVSHTVSNANVRIDIDGACFLNYGEVLNIVRPAAATNATLKILMVVDRKL